MAASSPKHRKVSDIKSNLLRPALTSHFEVFIVLPTFMKQTNAVQQDQLNLQCSEASLPGSSLATFEINNDFHGVTERHAYRRIFDDRIDFTFYVDADNYLPIRTFESWIGGIVNGNDDEDKLVNSNYYYTARYPDEYRTDLHITKFERSYEQDGSNIKYTFVKAFPISISAMPVSYDSSNLLKCTVGFTYLRYFTGVAGGASPAPDAGDAMDGGGSLPTGNPDQMTALQDGSTNGPGSIATNRDSVTGQRLLSTVDQIATQGRVGDGVTPALAKELQNFANGTQ
jgi:hypothetical protein